MVTELKGRELLHIKYGKGVVEAADNAHIWIKFSDVLRQFALNGVFAKTISGDAELIEYIRQVVQNSENAEKERIRQISKKLVHMDKATAKNDGNHFNLLVNAVYCDGGKNERQIGFQGVCSDENLEKNVNANDNRWCANKNCHCGIYAENKSRATRQELERLMEDGGYVCPESRLLRDWVVNSGVYNNRTPVHIDTAEGKICILTTLGNGCEEKDRYIFAVFVVESISKDINEVEQIWADSRYRYAFPENIAKQLKIWDFVDEQDFSTNKFALVDDETCAEILKKCAEVSQSKIVEGMVKFAE